MKTILKAVMTVAAIGFLTIGFAPDAAAQSQKSPSQFCKQVVEPLFAQDLGVPIGHSTCVTIFNGAGNGDVGVCKWARDVGAIATNEYGKCISKGFDPAELSDRIIQILVDHGVDPADASFAAIIVFSGGIPFGPTGVSAAVFASLVAGLVLVQMYRRKARSAVAAC